MIGTKFTAHSGNDHEWFAFKSHGLFSDTWYCYPVKRYKEGEPLKESFIQCFDTEFIKKNEIHEV